MDKKLIFHQPRILIQKIYPNLKPQNLILKICVGIKIYKFQQFQYIGMKRWQVIQPIEIYLEYDNQPIMYEILLKQSKYPQVIGEGLINFKFTQSQQTSKYAQLKSIVHYKNQIIGYLYLEIIQPNLQKQNYQTLQIKNLKIKLNQSMQNKYICILKDYQIIYKCNTQKIHQSDKITISKKFQVKLSNAIEIIFCCKERVKDTFVMFMIDNIQRGKNSELTLWLYKNKKNIGQVTIQYYLDNVFLKEENKCKIEQPLPKKIGLPQDNDSQIQKKQKILKDQNSEKNKDKYLKRQREQHKKQEILMKQQNLNVNMLSPEQKVLMIENFLNQFDEFKNRQLNQNKTKNSKNKNISKVNFDIKKSY